MKKTLLVLAVLFIVALSPAQSLQVGASSGVVQNQAAISGTQRADVIKKIFRLYDGVLQYRRWNETQGYWVDPDWINVG